MNWMELTATIVKALAWPVVVVLALVLLRGPLGDLLERLKKIKTPGGVEGEFFKKLELEKKKTLALLAPPAASVPEVDSLLKLVVESPRSAVDAAYRLVDLSAHDAGLARGEPGGKHRRVSPPGVARTVQPEGALDNETKSAIDEVVLDKATQSMVDSLRSLRDQAFHADESSVDPASAREYVQLAVALVQRIHEETPETPGSQ